MFFSLQSSIVLGLSSSECGGLLEHRPTSFLYVTKWPRLTRMILLAISLFPSRYLDILSVYKNATAH